MKPSKLPEKWEQEELAAALAGEASECEQLRAELAQAHDMHVYQGKQLQLHLARLARWQPEHTAPRDGTPVLIHATGYEVAIASFIDTGEEVYWMDDGGGIFLSITHWMPLPEPPNCLG